LTKDDILAGAVTTSRQPTRHHKHGSNIIVKTVSLGTSSSITLIGSGELWPMVGPLRMTQSQYRYVQRQSSQHSLQHKHSKSVTSTCQAHIPAATYTAWLAEHNFVKGQRMVTTHFHHVTFTLTGGSESVRCPGTLAPHGRDTPPLEQGTQSAPGKWQHA
jgi:hypothetical protein